MSKPGTIPKPTGFSTPIYSEWRSLVMFIGLLGLPALILTLLRLSPQLDKAFESLTFHLIVVSILAALALQIAVLVAIAAMRSTSHSQILLALGCLGVGMFMLGHGLVTPGIAGRPFNLWVGRFPTLAIAFFALCMALAAGPENRMTRFVSWRPRMSLIIPGSLLGLLVSVVIVSPLALSGGQPIPGESAIVTLVAFSSAITMLVTGSIHWRRWQFSRNKVQLALTAAAWLGVDALASLNFGQLWRISWWDYHAYLLAGFGATVWAVFASYRRSGSLEKTMVTLSHRNPIDHITHSYPESLDALVAAVEARDRYTHGHSIRVAALSTHIGIRLGVGPGRLRDLAFGAHLHDVGKIGVPDHILNKPGVLTDDEWEWIKMHPVAGWEIAAHAPSLRNSLDAIRFHHERWDGTGYPDHLSKRQIPWLARICAVADVWDALTSDRAYRPAWELDQALNLVVAGRETFFDPECVEALVDHLGSQYGLYPERSKIDLDVVAKAAELCHHLSITRTDPPSEERRNIEAAPPGHDVGPSNGKRSKDKTVDADST